MRTSQADTEENRLWRKRQWPAARADVGLGKKPIASTPTTGNKCTKRLQGKSLAAIEHNRALLKAVQSLRKAPLGGLPSPSGSRNGRLGEPMAPPQFAHHPQIYRKGSRLTWLPSLNQLRLPNFSLGPPMQYFAAHFAVNYILIPNGNPYRPQLKD